MTYFIDDYHKRVRKRLSRHEKQPVLEVAEALCFPSFHPETLLRVCRHVGKTSFRFVTLTENFWYSQASNPGRVQEVAEAPASAAFNFWKAVGDLNPAIIQSEHILGDDGMGVCATHTLGTATFSFECWCPNPDSPAGQFINLIYELGWESLKEHISIERLEQLHGYLSNTLPARLVHGEVTTLRLFGGLASFHEEELRRLFASISPGTPLVLDMTNCRGLGTVLYPIFIEFATRHPIIGWAISFSVRRQIEEMQLVEPHVFDSTADAVAWVLRRADESTNQARCHWQ